MKRFIAVLITLAVLMSGASLAAQEKDADVEAMLPVLDSVMRAMIDCNCAYAPDYDDYFWTTLCMLAVNWNMDDPLCELVGDELRVPRKLMEEYASAAFSTFDSLLPIGDDFTLARYDEAWDAYMVGLGDVGDSATHIAGYSFIEDGTVMVDVVMSSHDEPELYTMLAGLEPNPDGISYAYSVNEGILSEVGPSVRTRVVLMQGEDEEITETRYYSPYGYELWYDANLVRLNSPEGAGYEEFVPIDPDALPPVSLTIVLADASEDEVGELFNEAIADHANANWAMTDIWPDNLDSGLPCQVCEGFKDGVIIRLYQIRGALGTYCVTAMFPEEAIEGYGARLDVMIKTLIDEV